MRNGWNEQLFQDFPQIAYAMCLERAEVVVLVSITTQYAYRPNGRKMTFVVDALLNPNKETLCRGAASIK